MNLRANWNEQKGKLKQKFAWLTDGDLLFQPGKKDEMLARLQLNWVSQKKSSIKLFGAITIFPVELAGIYYFEKT